VKRPAETAAILAPERTVGLPDQRSGLTKRIIPCLDVAAGRVVKGLKFRQLQDVGAPADLAKSHADAGADELVLLDITATIEGRKTFINAVSQAARHLFIPFIVGGGIQTLEDAAMLFDAGADKVSINSWAVRNPKLIEQIAGRFGSQAVIVAVDAKRRKSHEEAEVWVDSGFNPGGRTVVEWVREVESRGGGEILLTSIDRDGTQEGFDCELTAAVVAAVSIPVIASGGAGNADHFVEVFSTANADAALAASVFHYGSCSIAQVKQAAVSAGIPMRWPC
jgi:imidazole glycerol-phosphate synthase subunit HisF